MISLTKTEGKVLLKLFKDFTHEYNANSLSKEIGISSRGSLKMLKKLEERDFLMSRKYGKAVFYKINFNDFYALKIIETLLIAEARENAARWIDEFKDVYRYAEIVLLFGSIIKNPKKAKDIDVVFVFKKRDYDKISDFILKKNKILFKRIHEIPQTISDFKENLKNNNMALTDAVKTGYVLHGQDKLVEVVKNVAGF